MNFRAATKHDLPVIIEMLANDELGAKRERLETPLPECYYEAFTRINSDPNQELIVLETPEKEVIGTLQLSFIPYLTYQGGIRAQIEAVRIHEKYRGQGMGKTLFEWAIARAKERGAHLLQLTTDRKRPEAIAFYKSLNFIDSHLGMKLHF